MANTLEIDIKANTADLQTKLALASADVKTHAAEVRKLATEYQRSSADMQSAMLPALQKLTQEEARAKTEVAALKREMSEPIESGLVASFDAIKGRFSAMAGMGGEIREIAEGFMAAFAVEKIGEWVNSITEGGAQVQHLSQQLGMSAESISTLSFAAKASGVEFGEMGSMLERLERNSIEAANGNKKAAAAFADMGLSANRLKEMAPDEMLAKIADAFQKTADGPAKTAVAMETMGRAGAAMIPVLDEGSAGLAMMAERAQRTGAVITGPMAEGMERTAQNTAELKQAFEGVAITLYEALKPTIDATISGVTELIESFNGMIKSAGIGHDVLTAIVIVVDGVVAGFETFSFIVKEVWEISKAAWLDMADRASQLGIVLEDVFSGKWGQISRDYKIALLDMQTDQANTMTAMADAASEYAASMKALYSNIGKTGVDTTGGTESAAKSLPPMKSEAPEKADHTDDQLNKQLSEEIVQMARDDAATTAAIRKASIEAEIQNLDAEVSAHQITAAQKITIEEQLQDHLYQANLEELQRELMIGNLSVVERNRVNNQILQLQEQHNLEMAKLSNELVAQTAKDAQQVAKDWNAALEPVGKSFDSTLEGMLEHHKSFVAAMHDLEVKLFNDLLEFGTRRLIKWVSDELSQTAATTAGVSARTSVQVSGAAAGLAVQNATNVATQSSNANVAAGSAYKSMVGIPIIGPIIAPVAAAGAFAAVEAFGAERGMGNVPFDNAPFFLHRSEMVLPAGLADRVRDMTEPSGGGDFHMHGPININQQPGQDGRALWHQIKGHMANDMKNGWRPPMRGA